MKTLAKAVIQAAAFLELSGENALPLETTVRGLEGIARSLHSASPAEVTALTEAVAELVEAETATYKRPEIIAFYQGFMENVGLQEGEKT